jgi:hypothetical protein
MTPASGGPPAADPLRVVIAGPWNRSPDSALHRRAAAHLAHRGVSVTYLATSRPDPREPGDERFDREAWPTAGCSTVRDLVWVLGRFRTLRPAVVHARLASAVPSMVAAALTRVPERVVGYTAPVTGPDVAARVSADVAARVAADGPARDPDGTAAAGAVAPWRVQVALRRATRHWASSDEHAAAVRHCYGLGSRPVEVHGPAAVEPVAGEAWDATLDRRAAALASDLLACAHRIPGGPPGDDVAHGATSWPADRGGR